MWDLLVLAAGTVDQARDFELQLKHCDVVVAKYAAEVTVVPDFLPGKRIGAGGATMAIVKQLQMRFGEQLTNKKILVIHSGGWSQRMPHLSSIGKIFATLPGGISMLHAKLNSYKKLPSQLPSGLVISACDVLEDVSQFDSYDGTSQMILFAHESNLKIATEHGVFVMDGDELICVLQKPSLEEMQRHDAIIDGNSALTDSFYWMSWTKALQLSALMDANNGHVNEISDELCCYGDYMRPLGSRPILGYLNKGSRCQQFWRKRFAEVFARTPTQVARLGPKSFFHIGTCREFLDHVRIDSPFVTKFVNPALPAPLSVNGASTVVECDLKGCKIGDRSYIAYSQLESCEIGSNCLVSDVDAGVHVVAIPSEMLIFTLPVLVEGDTKYVTCAFHIDSEFKYVVYEDLVWLGRSTNLIDTSLWDAPLFCIEDTREKSLVSTLRSIENPIANHSDTSRFISVSESVKLRNIPELLKYRSRLEKL